MAELNRTRAAQILCDAAYYGDTKTAKKWEITQRTIENYRSRLKTDPQLAALFGNLRIKLEGDWKSELARGITSSVRKIAAMIDAVDSSKPDADMLEALTGAAKTLAEIAITAEVINAGYVGSSQGNAEKGRAVA
jgi:hypothetical protein